MRQKAFVQVFLLFLLTTSVFSQTPVLRNVSIVSKAGVIASTSNTPFLLRSNQYGLIPLEPNMFYFNSSFKKSYDSSARGIDFGYGLEPHVNLSSKSQFLLPEAYVKVKWKAIEIYGGRRREVMGYVDTLGTMGSYIWSGNALPMPKIDIGIREFTPITKNGILAVKGNFAHGWFGNGDSVQNVLLHQKSFYLKLGKPVWNIKFIAGFNHQAQWGGSPTVPYMDSISGQFISSYGTSFKDFSRVFLGKSVGNDTGLGWDEVDGVPANEAGNRIGNHLGSIDIGIEIHVNKSSKIKIYRQSIFEDGSLFYLNNITDGLSGISISGPKHFNFTLEYFDTRSQGGNTYYDFIPELRGWDNYFNNGVYKDGWTYKGRTIGSPLLNPYQENKEAFNSLEIVNPNYIYNNRVQAINMKVFYTLKDILMSSQILHANNLGYFSHPIKKNSISIMQTGQFKWKEYTVFSRLAFDAGEYYPSSFGVDVSIARNW